MAQALSALLRVNPARNAIALPVRTGYPTLDQNRLLAALPAAVLERLQPALELVILPPGRVLHDLLGRIYFPTNSLISLSCELANGASGEIAGVGNEGLVGIAPFMGGQMMNRAVVQIGGPAFRISNHLLAREFEEGGPLQNTLLRYTQALLTRIAQTAMCNRFHVVEQQLCRWLLMSLDRTSSNELAMTQEKIAGNLGVRREAVTEAAGKLRADGLIHCVRGKVTVLDRPKLETRACECYAVVKREYDRLLSWGPRADLGQASAGAPGTAGRTGHDRARGQWLPAARGDQDRCPVGERA